jgi:hypothetical protein
MNNINNMKHPPASDKPQLHDEGSTLPQLHPQFKPETLTQTNLVMLNFKTLSIKKLDTALRSIDNTITKQVGSNNEITFHTSKHYKNSCFTDEEVIMKVTLNIPQAATKDLILRFELLTETNQPYEIETKGINNYVANDIAKYIDQLIQVINPH